MPGNLLNADMNFPNLTGDESTEEKFRLVTNYLYMLLEQLRYSFGNIGMENFNEDELDSLVNLITEPIYVQLKDDEGNIASLAATAEQLISRMSDAEGSISSLQQTSTSIMSQVTDLEGNVSALQQTSQSLTTRITDAEGNISSLSQTVNGFTLSVTNGTESSTIRLMSGSTQISSQVIQMSGMVTFTDLSGSGTTVINGDNITTGTISANRINMTGAITWSDLSDGMQGEIDGAYTAAQEAQDTADSALDAANEANDTVSGWTYKGTTYIDGAMLMTGTVMASSLQGGEVILLDDREREAGSLTLDGSSSYDGRKVVLSSGAIEINAAYGDVYVEGGDGAYVQLSDEVILGGGDTRPNNSRYSCGTSAWPWSAVYADTATIETSDERHKHDIEPLPDKYVDMLDALEPKRFKLDDGNSGRYHTGFIAQDVKAAMDGAGIDSMEFGGWCRDADVEGNEVQMLRVGEFVSILWAKIRKLEQRIIQLEGTENG